MSIPKLDKQKRQIIILYIATLGGTLLGVLSSIVNTRFLDASDYGDVRYVQNIINLVVALYQHLDNLVESAFRHIAMDRRCWLNSGCHDAAGSIACIYSLYESCMMNDIDFGEYVEDILTRLMNGNADYRSMIPCNYTPDKK